jgi:hypothetical protein
MQVAELTGRLQRLPFETYTAYSPKSHLASIFTPSNLSSISPYIEDFEVNPARYDAAARLIFKDEVTQNAMALYDTLAEVRRQGYDLVEVGIRVNQAIVEAYSNGISPKDIDYQYLLDIVTDVVVPMEPTLEPLDESPNEAFLEREQELKSIIKQSVVDNSDMLQEQFEIDLAAAQKRAQENAFLTGIFEAKTNDKSDNTNNQPKRDSWFKSIEQTYLRFKFNRLCNASGIDPNRLLTKLFHHYKELGYSLDSSYSHMRHFVSRIGHMDDRDLDYLRSIIN